MLQTYRTRGVPIMPLLQKAGTCITVEEEIQRLTKRSDMKDANVQCTILEAAMKRVMAFHEI